MSDEIRAFNLIVVKGTNISGTKFSITLPKPYVVIEIDGTKFQTISKRGSNPQWSQRFEIIGLRSSSTITFQLFHKKTLLGYSEMKVHELYDLAESGKDIDILLRNPNNAARRNAMFVTVRHEEGDDISGLRKKMLTQSAQDRSHTIALLSNMYNPIGFYPITLDPCEIVKKNDEIVGWGRFADCYQGLFLGKHQIAMKYVRRQPGTPPHVVQRRLDREVNVWKDLRHRYVLRFIGLCKIEVDVYMVSPWMEKGESLKYVRNNPQIRCARLLAQVADGLEYLHTQTPQVVHGDVKVNVLISGDGHAVIADFGLSHMVANVELAYQQSSDGIQAGNPRWQTPELLTGLTIEDCRRTAQSDMFAFGRLMLELITIEAPFSEIEGNYAIVIMVGARNEPPTRPTDPTVVQRGLCNDMWDFMAKCWNKDPMERPTATQAVAFLRDVLGD